MTPYEFAIYAEAFLETRTAELEEKVTLVWLHEYYHRQKYLPSLKDEITKMTGRKDEGMTDDEMLEKVKHLNSQLGGSIVNPKEGS